VLLVLARRFRCDAEADERYYAILEKPAMAA
jgi:hypothetical protein